MATTADKNGRMWECKQCHHLVSADETVAYHLVAGILYGWCASCFGQRERLNQNPTEMAA